ncbi:NADH dehydrogenase (ubiquinone) Fe-S protein 4 [Ketogulonicigenium robustum]|uniref:NADH dehydrogenase (Ubiquinone) Fe-S protein 4 n=1 Tax=Ketogulonicigenium robustum TaxID=92947 RepID=A0A1W6NYC1_9RHOB|nr:NADH dehydrogenase ubiquinone Fe-S protein 4 [Ketogulonicigenium robustum]ARO14232.1 NADH dehydrogenase (ubiquinone) Fe-S protein 4 [Ketogulonicigenium robustum]
MTARLYRPARTAMSSGTATAQDWVLEWETTETPKTDPLMGWSGGNDTESQLKLHFARRDDAMAYAATHGLDVVLLPEHGRAPNIRAFGYGENFMTNRRVPWSH